MLNQFDTKGNCGITQLAVHLSSFKENTRKLSCKELGSSDALKTISFCQEDKLKLNSYRFWEMYLN